MLEAELSGMFSPATCEGETEPEPEFRSISRSEPDQLSLSLTLPDSAGCELGGGSGGECGPIPVAVCPPNHRSRSKSSSSGDFSGEMCLKRSPRLSCNSLENERAGGGGSGFPVKSGGKRLLMVTHLAPVRRSPRFALIGGEIDNAGMSPVAGKLGLKERKGNGNSGPVKKKSSGSQGLKFKEITVIAKSLERESIKERQDESNNAEGGSRSHVLAEPLFLKWKDDRDNFHSSIKSCNLNLSGNKELRRSPRLQVMENGKEEEYVGKSGKRQKTMSSGKPSRRSPRFSETVENGSDIEFLKISESNGSRFSGRNRVTSTEKLVKVNGNNNGNEAIEKYEDDGLDTSPQKQVTLTWGYTEPSTNNGGEESSGKPKPFDLNAGEINMIPSEFCNATENGSCNGYTKMFDNCEFEFPAEEESKGSLLGDKVHENHSTEKLDVKFDKEVLRGMHESSIVIEPSDSSDERPAKKNRKSVENSHMKISDVEDSKQAVRAATFHLEVNGRHMSLNLRGLSKSPQEKCEKKTRGSVHELGESTSFFIGDPIPMDEAQEKWRWRYDLKNRKSKQKGQETDDDDEDKIVENVECHYSQAKVNGYTFSLGDFVYIRGEEEQKLIGKILEFFKTTDGDNYFRVQWFYRAEDTVMKQQAASHGKRRLFYSTVMNDNPIDCIISKVRISQVSPKAGLKPSLIRSDYYFDMEYCVEYSTFRTLKNNKFSKNDDLLSSPCTEKANESQKNELALLDLYSGCGGMSTGLCLGAKVSGVDVVTKWAVDLDIAACESLKFNHPETQVRNDAAGDFFQLLKEWQKLCKRYVFDNEQRMVRSKSMASSGKTGEVSSSSDEESESEEFEVERLVDICYGDPSNTGEHGLKYKVHWKGYSTSEDSWEPAEGLSNCQDCIRDFVRNGFKSKILPLPGDVDVICGGPPCQGISGYNRFRNVDSPLTDERNRQIIVFMDIVEFLKPKFILMENVVDILRLDKGSLGRYALSRLVHMRYQARLGIMAAGCYGLAQFRLRVFLWGAHPNQKLPQFPLPTHDVIVKYGSPPEFERNVVAYDEGQPRELEKAIVLRDAISDLPFVSNDEEREKMPYGSPPETEFQKYIRSTEHEMSGCAANGCKKAMLLHDHRPYNLFEDDYVRVCKIPKRKGANFRDLPGIIVGNDNTVRRDPSMKPVILPSGKPLLPDYVFTFEQGKSKRPFARLWWDETVPTVLTFPSCHNQAALHPEQDRMLTIREYARLQGFPDYYKFCGTVKERYCQLGNAVAVSVSRALGYALGMAFRGLSGDEPLMKLPPKFSHSSYLQLQETIPL